MFDLWAMQNGLLNKVVGLKYFNVFGPNEYHKADMRSVVIRAYFQAKQTGKVRLFKSYRSEYKDGEQCRDFIYVKDAAEISLHFFEQPDQNGIFNVGTGNPRTFNDLASAVFSALKKEKYVQYIDMPDGLEKRYQYYTAADTKKLRTSGYRTKFTSLESAIKDYVLAYLENDPRVESEGE